MSVAIYSATIPKSGMPAAAPGATMPSLSMNVNTVVAGAVSSAASAIVFNALPVPLRAGVPVLLLGPDSSGDYYVCTYPSTGEFYPTQN